ncbi:hypothetical protein [Ketobacter alkanivorans]|uniref:Type 1 pili tip component n=1 Tax=Ketobacter alkanivorans TaxID=1917421 RepID=A0A2K9LPV3_9GAMM|nr:hypothetical protein [Ketobacter alkanivorans]AUM14287.1 hypothetical protein Kalk_18470 [Ketobacter alkanivorans]MCP5018841.1 hypothetical protein [Ketobacter sp.]
MRIQELVAHWEKANKGERTRQQFSINLPMKEAAQVLALKEMYPDCTEEQILTDLLCFALNELSQSFPYEAGQEVTTDECGDPIYEDAGLTPKFIRLAQKYRHTLESQRVGEPN